MNKLSIALSIMAPDCPGPSLPTYAATPTTGKVFAAIFSYHGMRTSCAVGREPNKHCDFDMAEDQTKLILRQQVHEGHRYPHRLIGKPRNIMNPHPFKMSS